jgi:hypothetical protein
VAHLYGGDPKILYLRPYRYIGGPIETEQAKRYIEYRRRYEIKVLDYLEGFDREADFATSQKMDHFGFRTITVAVKGLIIGDMFFLLYGENCNFHVITQKEINYLKAPRQSRYVSIDTPFDVSRVIKVTEPKLVDLCKEFGRPVFTLSYKSGGSFTIDEVCPNLGAVGIASWIEADVIYQYLSYFVGNTMYDSPDTKPPVEVSNKNRILKAGFDLKTSFRGK